MTNKEELKSLLDKIHSENAVPEFPGKENSPLESKTPVTGITVERFNTTFNVKFIDVKTKKYLNTLTNEIMDVNTYTLVCDATNGAFKNFQINIDELDSYDVDAVLEYIN